MRTGRGSTSLHCNSRRLAQTQHCPLPAPSRALLHSSWTACCSCFCMFPQPRRHHLSSQRSSRMSTVSNERQTVTIWQSSCWQPWRASALGNAAAQTLPRLTVCRRARGCGATPLLRAVWSMRFALLLRASSRRASRNLMRTAAHFVTLHLQGCCRWSEAPHTLLHKPVLIAGACPRMVICAEEMHTYPGDSKLPSGPLRSVAFVTRLGLKQSMFCDVDHVPCKLQLSEYNHGLELAVSAFPDPLPAAQPVSCDGVTVSVGLIADRNTAVDRWVCTAEECMEFADMAAFRMLNEHSERAIGYWCAGEEEGLDSWLFTGSPTGRSLFSSDMLELLGYDAPAQEDIFVVFALVHCK
jgi:hypothetical protein